MYNNNSRGCGFAGLGKGFIERLFGSQGCFVTSCSLEPCYYQGIRGSCLFWVLFFWFGLLTLRKALFGPMRQKLVIQDVSETFGKPVLQRRKPVLRAILSQIGSLKFSAPNL